MTESEKENPGWWYIPPESIPAEVKAITGPDVEAIHELPWQAFAIVGNKDDPGTWKLPHHTRAIFRAVKGKIGIERTVDWDLMPAAVAAISRAGYRGQRVEASPEDTLEAAKHLADHYRKADKPLPDTLAILI